MSDCRNGGRLVYRRPGLVRQVDRPQVRGQVNFANAEPVLLTFSRYLEDGTERIVRDVELDGRRFVERPPRDFDNLDD